MNPDTIWIRSQTKVFYDKKIQKFHILLLKSLQTSQDFPAQKKPPAKLKTLQNNSKYFWGQFGACLVPDFQSWSEFAKPFESGTIRDKKHCFKPLLRIRIRDPVPFWPLDSGSEIRNRFFPDPGSRIPNPYFWEFSDNFLGKKFYNSLKIGPNFFLQHFKTKIMYNFEKFVAT